MPDDSSTKADIVVWLASRGVALDKKALSQLSKAELLGMVVNLLDSETQP